MLLIDTDAFIRLSATGHLERAIGLLGVSADGCRYLSALPYQFRKKLASKFDEPVRARIESDINRFSPIEYAPSAATQQRFVGQCEIDAGEAVLFGVLAEHDAMLMTTNDKRSLRALATADELKEVRQSVAGRIVAMDWIWMRLVQTYGVDAVATGVRGVAGMDTALTIVFSEANRAWPGGVEEGLRSYLRDLYRDCGQDLFYHGARS